MNLEELESIFKEMEMKYIDEQNIITINSNTCNKLGILYVDNRDFGDQQENWDWSVE